MQLVGLQGVDLFVTYVCNSRICLLEFFILKKSNEKNGQRQAKIKKDEHALTKYKQNNNNKEKTGKGDSRACMTRMNPP